MSVKLAPSILSADFGRLADEVQRAEAAGAEWIHVDVMDGHFVPNLTIGPLITRAVRAATELVVDVHLMIERPERYVEAFVDAGADRVTIHQESSPHLHGTLEQIEGLGARPGVALNPSTPVAALADVLTELDLLLVMSVNPGFGGQEFIPASIRKVRQARRALEEAGNEDAEIQVDGGISAATAPSVVAAGATCLVAGSAVYRHPGGVESGVSALRESVAARAPGDR